MSYHKVYRAITCFVGGIMLLNELEIKNSYSTIKDDIPEMFLIPILASSLEYKRSVGYFSCDTLIYLSKGMNDLINNEGKVKIITSINLSDQDISILRQGYEQREKYIKQRIRDEIANEKVIFNIDDYDEIINLIKYRKLDIKVAIKDDYGLYHDKMGLVRDKTGNKVCFVGSLNETVSAFRSNYEKIRVFKSWESPDQRRRIAEEEEEFDEIWSGNNERITVHELDSEILDAIKYKIDETYLIIKEGENNDDDDDDPIKLRPYQEKAKDAWLDHGGRGFFQMATGTGKTWTAVMAIKELYEIDHFVTIIVAPYKHLVEQWALVIERIFPNDVIIRVSSDFPEWETRLRSQSHLLNQTTKMIVLVTQKSFGLKRFKNIVRRLKDRKLLVVDEAHRFVNMIDILDIDYHYRLGLSATPIFINNQKKTNKLLNYFGGVVFRYNLEDALGTYLVNYEYHPFFVTLKEEEDKRFRHAQGKIASCFRNGRLVESPSELSRRVRARNAVLSKASEKEDNIAHYMTSLGDGKNIVVYCGDGYVRSTKGQEDRRYIDRLTRQLADLDYNVHKFTASESLDERMNLIRDFSKNRIDVLVAIRCLDEGIDIPTIEKALILASNNDPKEFIQRRGRILRLSEGKELAHIYDVIALPFDPDNSSVAKIELKRFNEYMKLAMNKDELMLVFDKYRVQYGITIDDVSVSEYDYDEWEEDLDE
jgi:superfamily II DNA or RNA helicase